MNIEAVRLPPEALSKMANAEWKDGRWHYDPYEIMDAQTRHLIELGWGSREELLKYIDGELFKAKGYRLNEIVNVEALKRWGPREEIKS